MNSLDPRRNRGQYRNEDRRPEVSDSTGPSKSFQKFTLKTEKDDKSVSERVRETLI